MNKAVRNTWILFFVSIILLYIKINHLTAKVVNNLSEKTTEEKVKTKKIIKKEPLNNQTIHKTETKKTQNKKQTESIRFETMEINGISPKTANMINNKISNSKIKFFSKVTDKITDNMINEKFLSLQKMKQELENIAKDIKAMISLKNEEDEANIAKTISVIESMPAQTAAKMFSNLNVETRKILLNKMDKEKISSILSIVEPHIATETFETAMQK